MESLHLCLYSVFLNYLLHCGVGVALPHCAIKVFPTSLSLSISTDYWNIYSPQPQP